MLSPEKKALIADVAALGATVTSKQIDRWRLKELLPRPVPHSSGRGAGVQRPTPGRTAEQIVALLRCLRENRSLDRAAVELWLDDFEVPVPRVRSALVKLQPSPTAISDTAAFEGKVEQLAETVLRRNATPERVRELARNGSLHELLTTVVRLALGEAPTGEELPRVSALFEKATGLDVARTDAPPGTEPWLTSDSSEAFMVATDYVRRLREVLDTLRDDDFYDARTSFRDLEKIKAFARLVGQVSGKNRFGMAALADSWLGGKEDRVVNFCIIVYLIARDPSTRQKLADLSAAADTAAATLRDAIAKAHQETLVSG